MPVNTAPASNREQHHPSFAPLADWLLGPTRMALLDAAVTLNVADILAETSDPEIVAQRLEAHPENTVLFLNALAALGLAEKKHGRYSNSPLAERYLRRDSETYLGELVVNLKGMQHRNLARLVDLVRSGPRRAAPEIRLDDPEHWARSARHLASYQKAGMADLAADIVAGLPESPQMRRMLDLGGGPGLIGLGILARHPAMTGALCDLAPVLEVAGQEIEAAGQTHRVTVIAGDYNVTDFGQGYDLVWASHNLYYARDLVRFMGRLLNALNPGGVFISLHEGLAEERTRPASCVLSRLSLALEGQDVSFEAGQIATAALEAGFASSESRVQDLPMGEVRVDILRKAGKLGGNAR